MGLLDRLRGGRRESSVSTRHEAIAASVSLLRGQDDLEVVGLFSALVMLTEGRPWMPAAA